MPSPIPIIVAAVGVVVLTSVNAAINVTPASPMPSPNAATSKGSPAATIEPNAMSRITSAAVTPTASAIPLGTEMSSGTSPPSSTWRPARSVAAVASSSAVMGSTRSVTGLSYCTVRIAVSPSSLGCGADTSVTLSIVSSSFRSRVSSAALTASPSRS